MIKDYRTYIDELLIHQYEYLGNKKEANRKVPLVSVHVITYQHVNYIEQCLNSILMQKTNFVYEIVIGEDQSSDGTREICIKYADKYPGKIRLFLRDREQTAIYDEAGKFIKSLNGTLTIRSCRGKYIALCEGDDYWTDPYKLQKQVDLLENNPEYVACFHGYEIFNGVENTGTFNKKSILLKDDLKGFEFTSIFDSDVWITQPLTALFRKEALSRITCMDRYAYWRDVHMFYHLLNGHKAYYMNQVMAVYRRHEGGVFSMIGKQDQLYVSYKIYRELFINNKSDGRLKTAYLSIATDLLALPAKKEKLIKVKILMDVFSTSFKDGVCLVAKGLKYIMDLTL